MKREAAQADRQPRPRSRSQHAHVGSLPVGVQQLIELSRVLFSGARIIILDEPTSALSPPEVARLFVALRKLRAEGRAASFSSRISSTMCWRSPIASRFSATGPRGNGAVANLTRTSVIGHMIGRGSAEMHMGETLSSMPATMLAPSCWTRRTERRPHGARRVAELRAGEITGVYGFMGCGQVELARASVRQGPTR
jgi:ribose transport system ATP-binding protein